MLEIVLADNVKRSGYEGRIDFDEGERIPSKLSLIDQTGNKIGEACIELSDFQYIGSGRLSARYRITNLTSI